MSGDLSQRSDLIDVTYFQLLSDVTGLENAVRPDQLKNYLKPRIKQLGSVSGVFGKPSSASRAIIESGSVTLADGVTMHLENGDRDYIFAVSSKFDVDEVQAFILYRSFLYNRGPSISQDDEPAVIAAQLVEAMGPFFSTEYMHTFRVLIPMFRAKENESHPFYDVVTELLPEIIPDGPKFAESIVNEYLRKTKAKLPKEFHEDPKNASFWAKQNLREQLVLLEVLFWTMWGYVPCIGSLVELVFETAYSTNLGSNQANNTLLLDEESRQLQEDCAALWILITVEILELETLGEASSIELSDTPSRTDVYYSSPESLKRLHDTVTSHPDSQYSCTYLAWTYVLSRLQAKANETPEIPASFQSFFDYVNPSIGRSYTKDREPIHSQMAKACLDPQAGLFQLIQSLLTNSPLFVSSVSLKNGSSVTDTNPIAYRSVLKGLIIALVELVPVELVPDFDALVDVWVSLFSRSESLSVTGICAQFWRSDWHHGIARRAIFDVARSRFPIQVKPLFRLLRAMTGSGFLETDPLYSSDGYLHTGITEERDLCDHFVFHYFDRLSSYSQVIPLSACMGPNALYERQTERYGSGASNTGLTYINTRPIRLPGGSILPAKSTGRLLSGDGSEHVVVCWQHEHSGWKVIVEILTDYANRRHMDFSSGGNYQDVSFAKRGGTQVKTMRIEDIGMERDQDGDDAIITDALDLVRSVIQDNPPMAQALMQSLEGGNPAVSHNMTEADPPDLVQLTTMILEEALSRSNGRARWNPPNKLITTAMNVLTVLLAIPAYTRRVWLYVRSTTTLFGSDRTPGFASVALAAERATGQYTMTLAFLKLVNGLFDEAAAFYNPKEADYQRMKEEVLLRSARFVHSEIWVEHMGWKYAQLGDRFEIGRRVLLLYIQVLENSPPSVEGRPFALLSQTIIEVLLYKATTSTITPLVAIITSSRQILTMLFNSRRHGDARRCLSLLQTTLQLCRVILAHKVISNMASRPCLLEQALCTRSVGGISSKNDPINTLVNYIFARDVGVPVTNEAANLLCALASSLHTSQPSPPTIIGHLSDPEVTVSRLVYIINHPYDDLSLRKSVWNFVTLAIDTEPALATLFVAGKSRSPGEFKEIKVRRKSRGKGKEKAREGEEEDEKEDEKVESNDMLNQQSSALQVAQSLLLNWKSMWDANPILLTCVFRFLDAVWQHAHEHKIEVEPLRQDKEFWDKIVSIACEEVGPVPTYETTEIVKVEGQQRSTLHEPVQTHAYRTLIKSHAVRIITRDISMHLQLHGNEVPLKKPESYLKLEPYLKSKDLLSDLLAEAAPSSYAPGLHDQVTRLLAQNFPGLMLNHLEVQAPVTERDYGDTFAFSMLMLRRRILAYPDAPDAMEDPLEVVDKLVLSINLNLSLVHAETALLGSWDGMLKQVIPYLRTDAAVRPNLLSIASTLSFDIAQEKRGGDMMSTIHGARLSLVLALIEVAWFSSSEKKEEVVPFIELLKNLRSLVLNEAQSPARSLLAALPCPFHRTLLQIIYFCAKQGRSMLSRRSVLTAEQRLDIAQTVDSILTFVIDALSVVFQAARTRQEVDLDRDMELLVAVFEQCTRRDMNASLVHWLTRCQEMDVIKASFNLYVNIDIVGLSDLPILLSRKRPLYVPHILLFHMALVSNPAAAERLASDGVLSAYSNNRMAPAASAGEINITLPELPGQRSPAHLTYCSMISIVAMVIASLGRQNHYFDAEACGFVQLYGQQILRALSWTINEPITLPLFEELEQVVNLFYALAASVPASAKSDPAVTRVLRWFTSKALHLLQQVNYAITHPNQLASMYEPVTHEERVKFEKAQSEADPMKQPHIIHLIHRLFQLSSNIVGTLVTISRADQVLSRSVEDWPISEALIVPHSKVVLGEPASLGTLLELGNRTLDILRNLVQRPSGQMITDPSLTGAQMPALAVKQGVIIARRNLEEILLYSVTQLAMWLSKPDFEASTNFDADIEDQSMDVSRPPARSSMTMAERLRRGMTGEMAGDLQALLTKSKAVITASNDVIGKTSVDLTQVLLNFLHERIGGTS